MEHRSDASGPKGRLPTTPRQPVRIPLIILATLLVTALSPALSNAGGEGAEESESGWEVKVIYPWVIRTVPHDTTAFTQGLEIHNGKFYESTGLYGESSVRIVNMTTGEVELQRDLPDEYFGEGLTIWNGSVIQLTWRENTGFIYELETLEPIGNFSYPGEGWGLCSDRNNNLWMSDGGTTLKLFSENLSSFEEEEVEVRVHGLVLDRWNELHCKGNTVYANRWYDDSIYQIHTETGKVCQKVDFSAIREQYETEESGVLNGIVWDQESHSWWVTGKNWSNYYEVAIEFDVYFPNCEEYLIADCNGLGCGGFPLLEVIEIFIFVILFDNAHIILPLLAVILYWRSKRQTEKPPPTSEEE